MSPLKEEAASQACLLQASVVGGVWNPLFPVTLATIPLGAHLPRKGGPRGTIRGSLCAQLGF